MNKAQEEHVQLINRIGVNSAINDKRYCISRHSHPLASYRTLHDKTNTWVRMGWTKHMAPGFMTPWVRVNIRGRVNINDKGCHVRSIAPFCHIAFYVTIKDEDGLYRILAASHTSPSPHFQS